VARLENIGSLHIRAGFLKGGCWGIFAYTPHRQLPAAERRKQTLSGISLAIWKLPLLQPGRLCSRWPRLEPEAVIAVAAKRSNIKGMMAIDNSYRGVVGAPELSAQPGGSLIVRA
jgi:hypothetical protein